MEILTLEQIRQNCRIDNCLEDEYLSHLGDTAEEMVAVACRKSWSDIMAQYKRVPRALHHACLLLVDHFYNNRGATTPTNISEMPIGVQTLIKPYVKLIK